MKPPYALVADVHCHSWSLFAQTNSKGVNTRLQIILDELVRAAETLKAAGGTTLRVAGDLFHVRGKIEPSVFNPTFDTFKHIAKELGIDVEIIPGNHDLEGKHSDELGNAMQQLDLIDGVVVITDPVILDDVIMLPWIEDLEELRRVAKLHADATRDLIIHAPLNGVIVGLPEHGLDPVEVAAWGFKRVFIGHYHNHAETAQSVYSIGATTHQTWSDPGTAAGFLLVYEDRIEHHPTQAPLFVNHDGEKLLDANVYRGNYVRMRLKDEDEEFIKARRKQLLEECGALAIVDHSSKKREIRRSAAPAGNVTLEVSVATYIVKHMDTKLEKKRIARGALEILTEARTVGTDE